MTLLTTEIHRHSDPQNAIIVFAADRRISRGNSYDDTRGKIFNVQKINAGIGYFGLAEVSQGACRKPMSDWLEDFLRNTIEGETLDELAGRLVNSLNSAVPENHRKSCISGFHIAGFNNEGLPEFWYVRNVDDDRSTLLGEYQAREDFQNRDAPSLSPNRYQIYRNGDIRAHVTIWEKIDETLGNLLNNQDFKQLRTSEDYVDWVKFKMELIAQFYEKYCTRSIIGKPVDAFSITRG
jgi:hypothetical protein